MNEIKCGNCIEEMKLLPENKVEMTLTDIPYGVVNRPSNGIRRFDKDDADEETFDLEEFIKEVVRVTKGSIYVFCGTEQVSFIRAKLVEYKLTTRLCILKKINPSPGNGEHMWLSGIECCVYGRKKGAVFNEHCKNPVWEYPCVRGKLHKTQKPLELFQYLIRTSSNSGDSVLDPCLGSGTTALAALKENRDFIGFDINPKYVEIAKNRIATHLNA
jgi:site-specific DNA-methyltransferase (adenine-specific)